LEPQPGESVWKFRPELSDLRRGRHQWKQSHSIEGPNFLLIELLIIAIRIDWLTPSVRMFAFRHSITIIPAKK
jgi:hypothetical protein